MSVERLTDKRMKGEGFIPVDTKEYKAFIRNEKPTGKQIYQRLLEIEDILGYDYDLDRLRELVEADRAGRVKILSSTTGMTCGACEHFKRIPGTCRGKCSERPYCRDKYGYTDERRGEFMPAQSRIACKMFDRRKGAMDGV